MELSEIPYSQDHLEQPRRRKPTVIPGRTMCILVTEARLLEPCGHHIDRVTAASGCVWFSIWSNRPTWEPGVSQDIRGLLVFVLITARSREIGHCSLYRSPHIRAVHWSNRLVNQSFNARPRSKPAYLTHYVLAALYVLTETGHRAVVCPLNSAEVMNPYVTSQ